MELGKFETPLDSGEARIRQLGYKQELQRNFGLLSNAALGFTVVSIITGITGVLQATCMTCAACAVHAGRLMPLGGGASKMHACAMHASLMLPHPCPMVYCSLLLGRLLEWRPCGDCVRVAHCLAVQPLRGGMHGGDNVLAANLRRAILLVRVLPIPRCSRQCACTVAVLAMEWSM